MDIYNWESNPRAHRKKVKKTGTVVFHPSLDLLTSFDRFLKPQPVLRANPFTVEDHDDDEEENEDEEEEEENLRDEENQGEEKKNKRKKVGPTMPLMTQQTVDALQKQFGFTELLPSQAQCYKGIFLRRDVLLHSRTGSGKTLAYALPIIERYLLFRARMKNKRQQQQQAGEEEVEEEEEEEGPFLIVFVFSVDLAVQTQGVLSKLYPQLRIEVPGYHQQKEETKGKGASSGQKKKKEEEKDEKDDNERLRRADILIGTVHGIDTVIRGHRVAAQALDEEKKEAEVEERLLGQKGSRQSHADDTGAPHRKKLKPSSSSTTKKGGRTGDKNTEEPEESEEEEEEEEDDDDDDEPQQSGVAGVVSAARVQAIVIDEVDTTLGPRFSSIGRRMKNLLKYIRKSNGALSPGLLTDYRAHHYVLCGATIPNWVIKAGFLGVKKYYYRLVNPGASKLPDGLLCYQLPCPLSERVSTACQLLLDSAKSSAAAISSSSSSSSTTTVKPTSSAGKKAAKSKTSNQNSSSGAGAENGGSSSVFLGRVVVFGNNKQIERLTAALENAVTALSSSTLPFYPLTARQSETERIRSIHQFNHSTHPCATLLCTDIAARGLDVAGADTILMLSLPMGPMAVETFIHRAGRTARVDRTGRCVVLLETKARGATTGGGIPNRAQWEEEQNSLERILQASHVQFQDFASTLGGKKNERALLQLEVRRPFHGPPRPGAPPLPTAKEVLQRELDLPSLESPSVSGEGRNANNNNNNNNNNTGVDTDKIDFKTMVDDIEEDADKPTQKVRFTVPMSQVHLVQKKLWKFQLIELGRV